MSDPYQRAEDIGIAHFIDRLVDQRDRAVRALAELYNLTDAMAYMPADALLNEPWAQEVLDG